MIKGELSALTAIQTTADPVISIELHFQGCVIGMLVKNTELKTKINYVKTNGLTNSTCLFH